MEGNFVIAPTKVIAPGTLPWQYPLNAMKQLRIISFVYITLLSYSKHQVFTFFCSCRLLDCPLRQRRKCMFQYYLESLAKFFVKYTSQWVPLIFFLWFSFISDIHDLFQEKPGYFELAQQLTVSFIPEWSISLFMHELLFSTLFWYCDTM